MNSARTHYSSFLAKHYTWMFGASFAAKVAEQKTILEDSLQPITNEFRRGLAIDLGCGSGFQSIALAQMGYSVLALDTSEFLLKELQYHQGNLPVQTICSDVLELNRFVHLASAQVIVCMGDTISHLPTIDAVENLLRSVFEALRPGGKFLISYRDLITEATGLNRFIPVFADENKIMTCFLEFDRPDSVLVHDLLYSRVGEQWLLEKSCYRKLRLPIDWFQNMMSEIGFVVRRGQAGGLLLLSGEKPNNQEHALPTTCRR